MNWPVDNFKFVSVSISFRQWYRHQAEEAMRYDQFLESERGQRRAANSRTAEGESNAKER